MVKLSRISLSFLGLTLFTDLAAGFSAVFSTGAFAAFGAALEGAGITALGTDLAVALAAGFNADFAGAFFRILLKIFRREHFLELRQHH
ncbi:MAG: hypothetical protein ACOYNV_27350 [Propionivibrio sp.]